MLHQVQYNSQRDNYSFAGKFPGWKQCFSTCAFMLMTFYWKLAGIIHDSSDEELSRYVDDVEAMVGKSGIGEFIKKKFHWIRSFTSYWAVTQEEGINKWMWSRGLKGRVVWYESGTWLELDQALSQGPVILHTRKLGGLRGGHLILLIGKENETYIVHDPYGDAKTHYEDYNGEGVEYPEAYLKKHAGNNPLFMYWEKGE